MLNFLARRIAQIVPTLFFVSVLIFSLQQLLPGDPALVMAGEERDPAAIEQIRQQYKLDQSIPVQYVYWLKGVLTGNFGESLRNKMPVRELIAQKLPVTLQLGSMAILIAFLIGIPAGIISAVKKGTVWDYGANLFALWGISTPNLREPGRHHHAGLRARQRNFSGPDAAHTQRHAPGSGERLCPHRARERSLRALGDPQARDAQRADADHHPRRARARHAVVGRGADRADLFHSRLRQADRGRRLQP
ncbi:Putative glutathione transporter permease component CDS [Bradyrhizobium sp.]|nr:Putative glutathione transporter permease component CDS [Bradyrhizobium sp.]